MISMFVSGPSCPRFNSQRSQNILEENLATLQKSIMALLRGKWKEA